MPKHRRPLNFRDAELQRVRAHWKKAREGDADAKEALLQYFSTHKSIDSFLRYWQKLKDMSKLEVVNVVNKSPQTPAKLAGPPTAWERARSTLTTGRVRVVSGGLPTLGKRSK